MPDTVVEPVPFNNNLLVTLKLVSFNVKELLPESSVSNSAVETVPLVRIRFPVVVWPRRILEDTVSSFPPRSNVELSVPETVLQACGFETCISVRQQDMRFRFM